MKTVVVITPPDELMQAIAKQLLPTPITVVSRPHGVFYFYNVTGDSEPNMSFRDPIDGEVLTESRTFPTFAAARAWVSATGKVSVQ